MCPPPTPTAQYCGHDLSTLNLDNVIPDRVGPKNLNETNLSTYLHRRVRMPPIRNNDKRNSIEIEGRIQLAISSLKNKETTSICEAARLHDVPHSTLFDQLNSCPLCTILRANSHQLTEVKEDLLIQWVLGLAKWGLPPRPAFVEHMANHLLAIWDPTSSTPCVGKDWVSCLVKHCTELQSWYSRHYNHKQAKCKDINIVQEWFNTLNGAFAEYGIQPENIYNFDETGFAIRLCTTIKVVTSSEQYCCTMLLQPGNHKWVTVINLVNASGWDLPSYIILKSLNTWEGWFNSLPDYWRLDVSPNS